MISIWYEKSMMYLCVSDGTGSGIKSANLKELLMVLAGLLKQLHLLMDESGRVWTIASCGCCCCGRRVIESMVAVNKRLERVDKVETGRAGREQVRVWVSVRAGDVVKVHASGGCRCGCGDESGPLLLLLLLFRFAH
jgi:hypothetical protein